MTGVTERLIKEIIETGGKLPSKIDFKLMYRDAIAVAENREQVKEDYAKVIKKTKSRIKTMVEELERMRLDGTWLTSDGLTLTLKLKVQNERHRNYKQFMYFLDKK